MRTCGPWGMRPRNLSSSRRPRVLFYLKATTPLCICVVWARRGGVSGGVFDHGTYEADGPGTWEALASPRPIPVLRRAGDPSPTHDTLASARVVGPRGTEEAPAAREAVGKGNRSHGRRRQGV